MHVPCDFVCRLALRPVVQVEGGLNDVGMLLFFCAVLEEKICYVQLVVAFDEVHALLIVEHF